MKALRRPLVVFVLLVTVGAVLLIVFGPLAARNTPPVRDAMRSRLGVIATAIIAAGVLLLGLLTLVVKRCTDRPHPPVWRVFRDEGGTAAVEMLLALPIMIMIILVILQAVLLWNAMIVFHYAAYATARSAVSIISCDLEISGEQPYRMFDNDSSLTPDSIKMARIRRAALLALLPVSGRLPTSAYLTDPEMTGEQAAQVVQQALQTAGESIDEPWIRRIADQYYYADAFAGIAISKPHHWNYAEPERGRRCPYHNSRREWGTNDWVHIPYCPYYPQGIMDYAPWEQVTVRTMYHWEMSIPWANKMLYELLSPNGYATSVIMPGTNRTTYLVKMAGDVKYVLSG